MKRHEPRPESGLVGTKVQRAVVGAGALALVAAVAVVRPWESRRPEAEDPGTATAGWRAPAGAPATPRRGDSVDRAWHYPGDTAVPDTLPGPAPAEESSSAPDSSPPPASPPAPPPATPAQDSAAGVLFREGFDDVDLAARGWYDNRAPMIVTGGAHQGTGFAEFRFRPGARVAVQGGALRRRFPPSDGVVVSVWVRYSAEWRGSGKAYHPHEFHVLTTEDDDYVGPSATHLTAYIEHNWQRGGIPRLAITDALNINPASAQRDLRTTTEQRAVAGCNGGPGTCYLQSGWRNGLTWSAAAPTFLSSPGPGFQGDWHRVEAEFRLNSIRDGRGVADGIARYWFDGQLVIERTDVLFRTGIHPDMKFAQFLIAPYIGDGSPLAQTLWVDDLVVSRRRVP